MTITPGPWQIIWLFIAAVAFATLWACLGYIAGVRRGRGPLQYMGMGDGFARSSLAGRMSVVKNSTEYPTDGPGKCDIRVDRITLNRNDLRDPTVPESLRSSTPAHGPSTCDRKQDSESTDLQDACKAELKQRLDRQMADLMKEPRQPTVLIVHPALADAARTLMATPAEAPKPMPANYIECRLTPDGQTWRAFPDRSPSDAEKEAMRHKPSCPQSVMASEDDCTCGLVWRDALALEPKNGHGS